jgi:hypothetical protein
VSLSGVSSSPSFRRRSFSTLLLLAAVFMSSGPADAWPASVYRNMVYDTLRIMPPSLGRVLWRNDEHLLRGVYRLEGATASSLIRDGLSDGLSRKTVEDVERRIAGVASMVDQHRPFREVAFELGKLLRIAADLADPSIAGAENRDLARASGEFYLFVTLHLEEFPLVYDRSLPSTLEGATVHSLLERLTGATDESVGRLARAFWEDGRLLPAASFDFRSVPFAEASLGYSRGVTAAAFLWLAAWSKANGDFTGYRFFGKDRPGTSVKPSSKKD